MAEISGSNVERDNGGYYFDQSDAWAYDVTEQHPASTSGMSPDAPPEVYQGQYPDRPVAGAVDNPYGRQSFEGRQSASDRPPLSEAGQGEDHSWYETYHRIQAMAQPLVERFWKDLDRRDFSRPIAPPRPGEDDATGWRAYKLNYKRDARFYGTNPAGEDTLVRVHFLPPVVGTGDRPELLYATAVSSRQMNGEQHRPPVTVSRELQVDFNRGSLHGAGAIVRTIEQAQGPGQLEMANAHAYALYIREVPAFREQLGYQMRDPIHQPRWNWMTNNPQSDRLYRYNPDTSRLVLDDRRIHQPGMSLAPTPAISLPDCRNIANGILQSFFLTPSDRTGR
jgi:hypothetical protein